MLKLCLELGLMLWLLFYYDLLLILIMMVWLILCGFCISIFDAIT